MKSYMESSMNSAAQIESEWVSESKSDNVHSKYDTVVSYYCLRSFS